MDPLISLLTSLIACPSITPEDAGCQRLIRKRLASIGFQCETLNFDKVTNLWAKYGEEPPLLVFAGHTDVVPPGPLSDWTTPPFEAHIREEHIYGRGAADMKGALAAMVIAAERFVKNSDKFHGSIAFLLTSDEEGLAEHGTKRAIETLIKRGINIDYCIIGEPSSNQYVGDQMRVGRRGSLHGKLRIQGKQGHVAHPHLALNPIHESALALHELATTEWDRGNTDFPPTSFQITNIHAGTGAANMIPGMIELSFNLRYSTALTVAQMQTRIEAILKKYHLNYQIEWLIGAQPFLTKRGTLIKTMVEAIHKITEKHPILSTGGGTSDGRFIAPYGIELVELGTSHETAHQVNECVSLEGLQQLEMIYYEGLQTLFNTSRITHQENYHARASETPSSP